MLSVRHAADLDSDGTNDEIIQRVGQVSSFAVVWGRALVPLRARDIVQTCIHSPNSSSNHLVMAPSGDAHQNAISPCSFSTPAHQNLTDTAFTGMFTSILMPNETTKHLIFASSVASAASGVATSVFFMQPEPSFAKTVSDVHLSASAFFACAPKSTAGQILLPDAAGDFGALSSLSVLDSNGDGALDVVFGFNRAQGSAAAAGRVVIFHANLPGAADWLFGQSGSIDFVALINSGFATLVMGHKALLGIGGASTDISDGVGPSIMAMHAACEESPQLVLWGDSVFIDGTSPTLVARGYLLVLNASILQPGWSGVLTDDNLLHSTVSVDADSSVSMDAMLVHDLNGDGCDDLGLVLPGLGDSSYLALLWGAGPLAPTAFWGSPADTLIIDDLPALSGDFASQLAGLQPVTSLVDVGFIAYSAVVVDVDFNGRSDVTFSSVVPTTVPNESGGTSGVVYEQVLGALTTDLSLLVNASFVVEARRLGLARFRMYAVSHQLDTPLARQTTLTHAIGGWLSGPLSSATFGLGSAASWVAGGSSLFIQQDMRVWSRTTAPFLYNPVATTFNENGTSTQDNRVEGQHHMKSPILLGTGQNAFADFGSLDADFDGTMDAVLSTGGEVYGRTERKMVATVLSRSMLGTDGLNTFDVAAASVSGDAWPLATAQGVRNDYGAVIFMDLNGDTSMETIVGQHSGTVLILFSPDQATKAAFQYQSQHTKVTLQPTLGITRTVTSHLVRIQLKSMDFNGDMVQDLVVCDPGWVHAPGNERVPRGIIHVFFPSALTSATNSRTKIYGQSLATGSARRTDLASVTISRNSGAYLGGAVAIGDLNGDGHDDLWAFEDDVSFMIWGGPNATAGDMLLTTPMDPAQGLTVSEVQLGFQNLKGITDASLGDTNADGFPELALGWEDDSWNFVKGRFLIESFRVTGNETIGWAFAVTGGMSTFTDGDFGAPVMFADINADGFDDLVVAAPLEQMGSSVVNRQRRGAVCIFAGGPTRWQTRQPSGALLENANDELSKGCDILEAMVAQNKGPTNTFREGFPLAFGKDIDFNGDKSHDVVAAGDDGFIVIPGWNASAAQSAVGSSMLSSVWARPNSNSNCRNFLDDLTTCQRNFWAGAGSRGLGFGTSLASGDFDGDRQQDFVYGLSGYIDAFGANTGSIGFLPTDPQGTQNLEANGPVPARPSTDAAFTLSTQLQRGMGAALHSLQFNADHLTDLAFWSCGTRMLHIVLGSTSFGSGNGHSLDQGGFRRNTFAAAELNMSALTLQGGVDGICSALAPMTSGDLDGDFMQEIVQPLPGVSLSNATSRGSGAVLVIAGQELAKGVPNTCLWNQAASSLECDAGLRGVMLHNSTSLPGSILGHSAAVGAFFGEFSTHLALTVQHAGVGHDVIVMVSGSAVLPAQVGGGTFDLATCGDACVTLQAANQPNQLGGFDFRIKPAICSGDVNGDGLSDLLVGMPAWSDLRGVALLIFGNSTGGNSSIMVATPPGNFSGAENTHRTQALIGAHQLSRFGAAVVCARSTFEVETSFTRGRKTIVDDIYSDILVGMDSAVHLTDHRSAAARGAAIFVSGGPDGLPVPANGSASVLKLRETRHKAILTGSYEAGFASTLAAGQQLGTMIVGGPDMAHEIRSFNILPSVSPSTSGSPTPSISPTPTVSPTSSSSPSMTGTPSFSPSGTPSQTSTPTASGTASQSSTGSPSQTSTPTPSVTATSSTTQTPSQSATQSSTSTPTPTSTPISTPTSSVSGTPTSTPSQSPSNSVTPSVTPSGTVTQTASVTPSMTATSSPSESSAVLRSASAAEDEEGVPPTSVAGIVLISLIVVGVIGAAVAVRARTGRRKQARAVQASTLTGV